MFAQICAPLYLSTHLCDSNSPGTLSCYDHCKLYCSHHASMRRLEIRSKLCTLGLLLTPGLWTTCIPLGKSAKRQIATEIVNCEPSLPDVNWHSYSPDTTNTITDDHTKFDRFWIPSPPRLHSCIRLREAAHR
jgi:hypothetical protein